MFESSAAKVWETVVGIKDTVVGAVSDFIDPKAKERVARDPLADLTMPAREGLGILLEIDATSMVSSTGIGVGPGIISPLATMALPPIIRLKTVEDGVHSKRIIDEGTRNAMVEDMKQQVRLHGEVMYVPKVGALAAAKA